MGLCMWHGFLFKQLPNTQRRSLSFPTHTQNRTKRTIKIKNPQQNLRKLKEREKEKISKTKVEINKIFKNYRKKKQQQQNQKILKKQQKETKKTENFNPPKIY
jgi:hypothetical protein